MDVETTITIDWAAILGEAAKTPLGVLSLLIIVLGLVSYFLFRNSDGRVKLLAFAMLIAGCLVGVKPVLAAYDVESERVKNEQRIAELISTCKSESIVEKHSCRAYDKSGFHSTPRAACNLQLPAKEGRFYAENQVTVTSESYRVIAGVGAKDAVKAKYRKIGETKVVNHFAGRIGCTNSSGTGRTCESKATIEALSYPDKCFEVLKELRL